MKKIGFGRTAEFVDLDNGLVLKLFYDKYPEECANIEYDINKKIQKFIDFSPKVYELKNVENRYGIVFEKIEGDILSKCFMKDIKKLNNLIDRFSETHSEINEVVIDSIPKGLEVFGNNIKRADILNSKEKDILLTYLKETYSNNLCHLDYHQENVMITTKNELKVIDWLTACSGNMNIDIARTYYLLRYGESPLPKSIIVKILEKVFKRYISNRYLHNRLGRKINSEFKYFLFIIEICRLQDNVGSENRRLIPLINRIKEKTINEICAYNSAFNCN
jgi:hypothetical protein